VTLENHGKKGEKTRQTSVKITRKTDGASDHKPKNHSTVSKKLNN